LSQLRATAILSPVSIQTQAQARAFLAVFVYATHAIVFEWKLGFILHKNIHLVTVYEIDLANKLYAASFGVGLGKRSLT